MKIPVAANFVKNDKKFYAFQLLLRVKKKTFPEVT